MEHPHQSLYPDANFKTVIVSELLLVLAVTHPGSNQQIYAGSIASGVIFGVLSDPSRAADQQRSWVFANNIVAPTLQFRREPRTSCSELDAAMTNGQQIATANPTVPATPPGSAVGHGCACWTLASQRQQGAVNMDNTLMWTSTWPRPGTPADGIPKFQWFDQTGQGHSQI